MKELYLADEPYIGRVILPTGEAGAWFYNPETTTTARFVTKVVFKSSKHGVTHTFMLLLPQSNVDCESISKAWSIAEDLSLSESNPYTPHFADEIYAMKECVIER